MICALTDRACNAFVFAGAVIRMATGIIHDKFLRMIRLTEGKVLSVRLLCPMRGSFMHAGSDFGSGVDAFFEREVCGLCM